MILFLSQKVDNDLYCRQRIKYEKGHMPGKASL